MRATTLEKLVWVLIYGGLLMASLGAFMRRGNALATGLVLVAGGLVSAVCGAVLVVVRARMPTPVEVDATAPPAPQTLPATPSSHASHASHAPSPQSAPDGLP